MTTVQNPIPVETASTFYSEGGQAERFWHQKNGRPRQRDPQYGWAEKIGPGIETLCHGGFSCSGRAHGTLETVIGNIGTDASHGQSGQIDDKAEPGPQVAAVRSRSDGLAHLRRPKDYDDLKKDESAAAVDGVELRLAGNHADTISSLLKWLPQIHSNWGWAIVCSRCWQICCFSVAHLSYKSTMKIGKRVAPKKSKRIQEKYKKYKIMIRAKPK